MGKITDIKYQKNKARVNLYIDGTFYSGIQTETLFKNNLKIGSFVDENNLSRIMVESEKDKAFERALSLIEKKLYFERELRKKLKEKGYIDDVIDIVIGKLKDYKYIDDDALVKTFMNSQKTKSKREIEFKLKQKGVSDYYIDKNIDIISDHDEYENCRQTCEKYSRNKEKNKENGIKTLKYLTSKGFSYENAKRAVREKFAVEED